MDNIVPSRFSCLKIEDDEFHPVVNKSSKKTLNKQQPAKKPNPSTAKKIPGKQEQPSNGSSKKSKTKVKNESKQWEEWQKKDNEYINENFEQDLQSAILQSRLDYEHHKKNYVPVIITQHQDKSSKKKKAKTMSLDQFLEGDSQAPKKESEASSTQENEKDFFQSVVQSTKEEIRKEKVEEKRRERSNNIEEIISLAQCQEKLQKEREKNELLKKELEEAKKEITLVKKRNKTLCNMLSQGEMKDKATVLLELEKLTTVKEELTDEVGRLHKLLEQERSKSSSGVLTNSAVSDSYPKQKNKKKKS